MDERAEGEKRLVPEVTLKLVQNLLKVGAKNVQENVLHTVSIGVHLRGQRTVFFRFKYGIYVSNTFMTPLLCTCSPQVQFINAIQK